MPTGTAIEAGCFEVMPDNDWPLNARGDIFLVDGAFDKNPNRFSGVLLMAWMKSWNGVS